MQYLIDVYRRANLASKVRQTILTHDDQLVSLQLCMAQYNKEVGMRPIFIKKLPLITYKKVCVKTRPNSIDYYNQ